MYKKALHIILPNEILDYYETIQDQSFPAIIEELQNRFISTTGIAKFQIELDNFKRGSHEQLRSCMTRYGRLLKATEHYYPLEQREIRRAIQMEETLKLIARPAGKKKFREEKQFAHKNATHLDFEELLDAVEAAEMTDEDYPVELFQYNIRDSNISSDKKPKLDDDIDLRGERRGRRDDRAILKARSRSGSDSPRPRPRSDQDRPRSQSPYKRGYSDDRSRERQQAVSTPMAIKNPTSQPIPSIPLQPNYVMLKLPGHEFCHLETTSGSHIIGKGCAYERKQDPKPMVDTSSAGKVSLDASQLAGLLFSGQHPNLIPNEESVTIHSRGRDFELKLVPKSQSFSESKERRTRSGSPYPYSRRDNNSSERRPGDRESRDRSQSPKRAPQCYYCGGKERHNYNFCKDTLNGRCFYCQRTAPHDYFKCRLDAEGKSSRESSRSPSPYSRKRRTDSESSDLN
jgi:hypothetical protein